MVTSPAMDTEFPGVVARPIGEFKSTSDYQYQVQSVFIFIVLSFCSSWGATWTSWRSSSWGWLSSTLMAKCQRAFAPGRLAQCPPLLVPTYLRRFFLHNWSYCHFRPLCYYLSWMIIFSLTSSSISLRTCTLRTAWSFSRTQGSSLTATKER